MKNAAARWMWVFMLLCWLAILLACAPKTAPAATDPATGRPTAAPPGAAPATSQACVKDQDCSGQLICENGHCVQIR